MKWETGEAIDFWMEENIPTCPCHNYVFFSSRLEAKTHSLLKILSLLKIIDYGCIWEQFSGIRIKVR